MNDDETKAATEIAKVVLETTTVYDDAFKPAAIQIGKSLETATKAVNVALFPLKGLIWGYEQFENFLRTKVAPKLRGIPEEQIKQPNLYVVGPALEALRYTTDDEVSLQNLFANLLANTLDSKSAHKAHPSFVDVINVRISETATPISYKELKTNLSLLGSLANCQYDELSPNYLDNLCRLGLLTIPVSATLDESIYEELENDPDLVEFRKLYNGTFLHRKLISS